MLQLVCCKSTTGGCKKESEEHKDMRKVVWATFCTKHQQTAVHIERAMKKEKKDTFTSRLEETCTALYGAGIGTLESSSDILGRF